MIEQTSRATGRPKGRTAHTEDVPRGEAPGTDESGRTPRGEAPGAEEEERRPGEGRQRREEGVPRGEAPGTGGKVAGGARRAHG